MKYDKCCPCSVVPIPGHRILTFADGSESGVIGLDKAMEDMRKAGKSADRQTASEIVDRLAEENYVGATVRHMYEEAVLREYSRHLEAFRAVEEVPLPGKEGMPIAQKAGFLHRVSTFFQKAKR